MENLSDIFNTVFKVYHVKKEKSLIQTEMKNEMKPDALGRIGNRCSPTVLEPDDEGAKVGVCSNTEARGFTARTFYKASSWSPTRLDFVEAAHEHTKSSSPARVAT